MAICGTKDCSIKFRGLSVRSTGAGWLPSADVPPKTEPERFLEAPLGEADLEPAVADVEAKREETEALGFRYVRLAVEDAIDGGSVPGRVRGGFMVGVLEDPGGSKGDSSFEDVMKTG